MLQSRAVRRLLQGFLLACVLEASAWAAPSVCLPPASGPARSGAEKIEAEVRDRLRDEGLPIVSDRSTVKGALQAGADLLLVINVTKAAKKYSVEGRLVDVARGEAIKVARKSYKRGGAAKAGRALADELVAVAVGFQPSGGQDGGEDPPPAPARASRPPRAVSPPEPEEEETSRSRAFEAKSDEAEADGGGASATLTPEAAALSGDGQVVRASLGIGTQLGSAYAVSAPGGSTGLAYSLGPLFALAAQARVAIPGSAAALELDLSFSPVAYSLNVQPAVVPANPSGHFLNFGVTGLYEFGLPLHFADRVYLAPMVGLLYDSLSVDQQSPSTVVLSSGAFGLAFGGRGGLQLGRISVDATLKLDYFASYSESPQTTGDGGRGLGVSLLGAGRYWLSSNFGLMSSIGYEFMSIGFSGKGTRVGFQRDPQLTNASVAAGNAKVIVGVVVAI